MDDKQQLREDFITEVMVFSPKYNIVTASALADQLTQDELEQFTSRLRRINDKEAEYLAELEDTSPSEYQKRMEEIDKAEEEADEQFFTELEKKLVSATDDIDKVASAMEQQIDADTKKTEAAIEKQFNEASALLKQLYQEVEHAEQKPAASPTANQPIRPIAEVKKELEQAATQGQSSDNN